MAVGARGEWTPLPIENGSRRSSNLKFSMDAGERYIEGTLWRRNVG